jgi:hypothetical protein
MRIYTPNRTDNSCQEWGRHILRFFFMESPLNTELDGGAVTPALAQRLKKSFSMLKEPKV